MAKCDRGCWQRLVTTLQIPEYNTRNRARYKHRYIESAIVCCVIIIQSSVDEIQNGSSLRGHVSPASQELCRLRTPWSLPRVCAHHLGRDPCQALPLSPVSGERVSWEGARSVRCFTATVWQYETTSYKISFVYFFSYRDNSWRESGYSQHWDTLQQYASQR